MSLREEIFAKDDLPLAPVACPEWTDEKLFVRAMSGKQRARVENLINSRKSDDKSLKDTSGLREMLTCFCLCDAQGGRVFQDEDMQKLADKSGKVLDRIATLAMDFNKLTEEAIEGEEKN